MESVTCCGMELIAKQSHGIKPQEDARVPRDEIKGGIAALDDIHRTSRGDDIPSLRLG